MDNNAKENTSGSAETPARNLDAQGVETLILKSGRTARIFPGKGLHVRQAQAMIEGKDANLYLTALMSLLVEIDGHKFPMEAFEEETTSGEYMEIMTLFTERNFF